MKHMKTLDRSLDTPKAKLAIKYLPFFLSSSQSAEQKTEKNAVLLLNQGRLNIALLLRTVTTNREGSHFCVVWKKKYVTLAPLVEEGRTFTR
jgi:hypothetical protein